MKEITQIENYNVEIWRRAYQRSMNLTVRPDGTLRVTCGRRIRYSEIARFVKESNGFIQKRMLEIESLRKKFPRKEYVSGEKFLYSGREMPLELLWTWSERIKVHLMEDRIEIVAPLNSKREQRRDALHGWFKRTARMQLEERLINRSIEMKVFPRKVSIRGQHTRWGSCSERGEISLNWKLLAAPAFAQDYVIVHELAHLTHMDHSQRFWDLVENFHPDWRASRFWLRENEFAIAAQFR